MKPVAWPRGLQGEGEGQGEPVGDGEGEGEALGDGEVQDEGEGEPVGGGEGEPNGQIVPSSLRQQRFRQQTPSLVSRGEPCVDCCSCCSSARHPMLSGEGETVMPGRPVQVPLYPCRFPCIFGQCVAPRRGVGRETMGELLKEDMDISVRDR